MTETDANERRFAEALAEFNAGHFYEAHEIFEELWSEEVGARRLSLQALVQAAAGYHKAEIGVSGGARKLWAASLRLLDGQPEDSLGIDVAKLRVALRRSLDSTTNGAASPLIELP